MQKWYVCATFQNLYFCVKGWFCFRVVDIFEHVQWRWTLNDRLATGRAQGLGSRGVGRGGGLGRGAAAAARGGRRRGADRPALVRRAREIGITITTIAITADPETSRNIPETSRNHH